MSQQQNSRSKKRANVPEDEMVPEKSDNNLSQKLIFYKKMRELNNKQIMQVVQEVVHKFPYTIKDIMSDEVKIKIDDLDSHQFTELNNFVDMIIQSYLKDDLLK